MSIPDPNELEKLACTPVPVSQGEFNPNCTIPYGVTVNDIRRSMEDFVDFLGFINQQLHNRSLARLESMLMPASFSSLVGEFMHVAITKYCKTLVKNQYHSGHPDLIPINIYAGDAILHGTQGIEIKASRNTSGWQGHNAEEVWLMVFVFDSNTQSDRAKRTAPNPFKFLYVVGAQLTLDDWSESGRSATSRRTPTASVLKSGHTKMMNNWIFRHER
jgi:hypothetical protein